MFHSVKHQIGRKAVLVCSYFTSLSLSLFFTHILILPLSQALTLLEYLLKTGSDRIPKQCKENAHTVKALTEYRFLDKDGKDQVIQLSLMSSLA